MIEYLRICGPYGHVIVLLALVNLLLTIRCLVRLSGSAPGAVDVRGTSGTILFWGALCAVLGFLGQYTGIYNALGAIIRATEIDPRVCAEGFRQSFSTTLAGLGVLVGSAIAWFVLRAVDSRKSGGRTAVSG